LSRTRVLREPISFPNSSALMGIKSKGKMNVYILALKL
jgi:hypothetical protein